MSRQIGQWADNRDVPCQGFLTAQATSVIPSSGVETGGSGGSWGPKGIITITCVTKWAEWYTHLCRAHTIFHSRRGHLKAQKHSWRLEFTPDPTGEKGLAVPPQNRTPSLSLSGFGPSASQLRASNLLLNHGPAEPCYVTVPIGPFDVDIVVVVVIIISSSIISSIIWLIVGCPDGYIGGYKP